MKINQIMVDERETSANNNQSRLKFANSILIKAADRMEVTDSCQIKQKSAKKSSKAFFSGD